jgi:hypothetical protein
MKAMQQLLLGFDCEMTKKKFLKIFQSNILMFTCSLPILLFVLRSMNSTGDIVGYCGR